MSEHDVDLKVAVRERYAGIAKEGGGCCLPTVSGGCCGGGEADDMSLTLGYSEEDLRGVPEGANLGLGCGNPVALASLAPGEVVVDLGSGAGFDCFLAGARVGAQGRVIGVDMTPAMLDRARANATKEGITNVEFRLGEIENLPVGDASADVVISNCVINLSTDKARVFREAFRVLRPGGRLMVSDLVLLGELPASVKRSVAAYAGCISGAMRKEAYLDTIRAAGFEAVTVESESIYPIGASHPDATETAVLSDASIPPEDVAAAASIVASVKVRAVRPS